MLEIQTDHKVENISVIFHTLVTKFYKLFCMAVSDKVGGYFHLPKPKPDPNDLLTYKTRDSLRANESSFDPYMFQLAGEMVSARLELQQIGRRNETSNTMRVLLAKKVFLCLQDAFSVFRVHIFFAQGVADMNHFHGHVHSGGCQSGGPGFTPAWC